MFYCTVFVCILFETLNVSMYLFIMKIIMETLVLLCLLHLLLSLDIDRNWKYDEKSMFDFCLQYRCGIGRILIG